MTLLGCSAPNNIKPSNKINQANVLANSQHLETATLSHADWPEDDWWRAFNDTQLIHLVELSQENSPTLQLADANLAKASAIIRAADTSLEPHVEAQAGASRSRLSRSEDYAYQGNTYGTLYRLGLHANYDFDLWGGNRTAWEATVNQYRATEVDHQAAKIALSSSIVSTYIELANAYRLLDLSTRDLKRTQRIVSITDKLLNNGLTSEDRLYTAQSGESRAKQQLKQHQLIIEQLKNALATLVASGPELAYEIKRPDLALDTLLEVPKNLPADLLSHRADIIAAKWRIEATSANIAAAKTRYYPNLNLSAMAGFKAVLGDAIFADESRSWQVGPAISLPLFSSQLDANLMTASADYDTAVAQYNQTLTTALGDVADTILVLKSVQEQLVDAKNSANLAKKSYEITENRYQAGMGSQLEVLIAQQQLLDAESAVTMIENKQQTKHVELINVLGGGFVVPSDNSHSSSIAE